MFPAGGLLFVAEAGRMSSLRRRLLIALTCLGGLVLILGLADVELARHHTRTSTSVTLLSPAGPASRPSSVAVFIERTEPPALGEALEGPLTKQLESRGVSVRPLEEPLTANERPGVSVSLRAAPLSWNPLRASATVTARLQVFGGTQATATARGKVTVTDTTTGLTSRTAYLRHLAEVAAGGIAQTLTETLAPAPR
jgi:hypothetical protein